MLEPVTVQCPYCFETVEILLDPESRGEMVHDCDVCCNPWLLRVAGDGTDGLSVTADRAQ
ncbi:MAG: CPXCG motif-containing cysteine-rich protein [Acidobacteriota bacterium]